MMEPVRRRWTIGIGLLALLAAGTLPGCALVPRDRLDESQRIARSLRTENARLKDQVVTLQTQNRDYADRAIDDLRRLTARDQAIARLEQSVQGYQDDRDRLAAAYLRLAVSLGRTSEDSAVEPSMLRREESRAPVATDPPGPGGLRDAESLAGPGDGDRTPPSPPPASDGSDP